VLRCNRGMLGGRSPRVRGRRHHRVVRSCAVGSIPARAGETMRRGESSAAEQVDPRACGGDAGFVGSQTPAEGRSPRVRGRPAGRHELIGSLGSIPARAGETGQYHRRFLALGVDPRACGGDAGFVGNQSAQEGRSPRVRGRHKLPQQDHLLWRSIPARAGETSGSSVAYTYHQVDPRACGGDAASNVFAAIAGGRSPRVRGRRPAIYLRHVPAGSIPARAGETSPPTSGGCPIWVDPRACGGDRYDPGRRPDRPGRSPRVRGRHDKPIVYPNPFRSIPARAGETRSGGHATN